MTRPPKPAWNYLDALLLTGAMPVILLAAGFLVVVARLDKTTGAIAAQLFLYAAGLAALWALLRARGLAFLDALAWNYDANLTGRCLVLGPPLAMAVGGLGYLLGAPDIDLPIKQLLATRTGLIAFGLIGVTLGPLFEEFIFRGFLLPLAASTVGPHAAIAFLAIAFGLLHGPEYAWSWQHVTLVTLAGIAFSVTRWWTGSTAAATALHATYNLTFFIGLFFQQGEPK